ncbi:MAG: hypothetical protein OIF51_16970 [Cellvibrionaceae bacterium]|nr:hypothetical protein [Cellvibrionaceae bacterium]
MEKVLLIGGTGLLGPSVLLSLQEKGREVVCLNRRGEHPFGGEAYSCDRSALDQLKGVFDRFNRFCLIDMIPYSAQDAGTLILALNGKQVPITAISSIDVYRAYNVLHNQSTTEVQETPLFEGDELRERLSFQGAEYDKLNVERIYYSYFDDCKILRLPAIYGLPDISRIEPYFKAIHESGRVRLNSTFASWKFSRSSNVNIANAIALSLGFSGREVFNLAEPIDYTEEQWCNLIAKQMGVPVEVELDAKAEIPYGINTQQHWFVDSSKIRRQLGYTEKFSTEEVVKIVVESLLMRV